MIQQIALVVWAAAVVFPASMVSGGDAPMLELYTMTNNAGAMYTVTGPHHNLGDEGFNDVTRSICGVGVWFLYEDKDYSHNSKFVHTFASETYACEDLDSTQWDKVSSVRYAGMDDITFPTLTMYHDANQCGGELLVVRDLDTLPDFNDQATSFVVTGTSSWTVYTDSGYGGGGACLEPSSDGGWYGVWNHEEIGMSNDEVSSVRKGCHTDRVFKYDPSAHL
ncbi:uncharacterized protein LOC122242129 [Penaeus japonicus]|uniref:uncharacterized protein LOC122242129 n=1 Tax=Penaeus japonicus TaxID=27405 RepID=UPI001C70F882|nr:uncharacterized protein LOC122242129 [Penaeus japonicus]XP_042855287.1 uncharacterized protein LOC122242129 [Penaeus japonicus]XP_042855288.1 uncharacterized protein LOC122242129 [Penaeus japonicus]